MKDLDTAANKEEDTAKMRFADWNVVREAYETVLRGVADRVDRRLDRGTSVKVYRVGPVIRIDIK